MRLLATQKFVVMRREIDNEQPTAGLETQRGFTQCARRIIEEVQHLMQNDGVEPLHLKRERVDIALPEFSPHTCLGELRTRHGQHCMAGIDADKALGAVSQNLQHATRARAQIKQGTAGAIAKGGTHRRFDFIIRNMKRTDAIPFSGMTGEIGLCRLGPRGTNGIKTLPIRHQGHIGRVKRGNQRPGQRPAFALRRKCKEGPRPFAMPNEETGLDHQFEMAGNAGLRLAKNVGQIGDGEFASGQQGEQTQARIFARRP